MTIRVDNTHDVFTYWQARIHIAHRKDRTISVAGIAKIMISPERKFLCELGTG